MTFMVYYCPDHRKAWPISERPACPVGGGGCVTQSRDAIVLVNNFGKLVGEMDDALRAEGRAFVPGDGMVSPPP